MDQPIPVDLGRIAQDLQIRRVQVENVVQLLDEGNTVPFITRYRKERTGGLNEVLIREIQTRVMRLRELAERKETILRAIEGQGKLTDELRDAIRQAENSKRLEDLYLPFKPKKRTKASEARERGLEPLALRIWNRDEQLLDLAAAAQEFVDPEKQLETPEKVLEGVGHILAESINELAPVRDAVRRVVWRTARLVTTRAENLPETQGLDYRDYFNYTEPVNHAPAHRILAINRGEKEGVLKVKIDVPQAELERALFAQLPLEGHPQREAFTQAAQDALSRLLLPSLEREVRRDLTDAAERHAVDVFARNLNSLLLQPPITRQRVLAVDPGFRTGCKLAILDEFGTLLEHEVIHPHPPQNRRAEAKVKIKDLVGRHSINVVAIGNGTACRETEELIAEVIAEGTYFNANPEATTLPGAAPSARPAREEPAAPEASSTEQSTTEAPVSTDTPDSSTADTPTDSLSTPLSTDPLTDFVDQPVPSGDMDNSSTSEPIPPTEGGTDVIVPESELTPASTGSDAEAPFQEPAPEDARHEGEPEEPPPPIMGGAPDENDPTPEVPEGSDWPTPDHDNSEHPFTPAELTDPESALAPSADTESTPSEPAPGETPDSTPAADATDPGLLPPVSEAEHVEASPADAESSVSEVVADTSQVGPGEPTPGETLPSEPTGAEVESTGGEQSTTADPTDSATMADPTESTTADPTDSAAMADPTESTTADPTDSATMADPTEFTTADPTDSAAKVEDELVRPVALDFTHLPVGPKPKSEGKPPRAPRPPKTPPPPPAPHAADPLLALLSYVIVNEAGASVYSTSPQGRDEFPTHDATTRGTISIGRRLQDPLAELVKIEPQNIGVGLYQHDINPKQLKESLESVVESCVNFVGVDLNTASVALLRHVAGLNALTAQRMVDYRKQNGPFTDRLQIQQVEGVGPVTYTQAAGFLKIRDAAHPFDRTWVHPESYEAAEKLLASLGLVPAAILDKEQLAVLHAKLTELDLANSARELAIGEPTLRDICEALARPDRDPREDLPKPIFKKGVLKLEDLSGGMELKGTVLNVVDFGAFVDIGLKDSGLVHISQLANRYVKSPHDVVSVGDVVTVWVLGVDGERKRVSLSMVPPGTERSRAPVRGGGGGGGRRNEGGGPGGPGPEGRGPREGRPEGGGPQRSDQPRPRAGSGERPPRGGDRPPPRSEPPAPTRGLRIPGPPQRSQQRGGPRGRGGPGGPGRDRDRDRANRPPESTDSSQVAKPKAKPSPSQALTNEAISGNVPLRSFGQLKQLYELRSKGPDDDQENPPPLEGDASASPPSGAGENPPSNPPSPPASEQEGTDSAGEHHG